MIDEQAIKRVIVQNALKYGKTDLKFVINKVIGLDPSIAKNIKEYIPKISAIIEEVNSYSKEELERVAKELGVEEEKKEEVHDLKPLPNVQGSVVLRIPPEPSGYMHLGHAISFMINYLYKLKYNGKLWLRFEDTNPEKASEKFINYFKKYISWLGIKWDEEKLVSDDMEILYSYGEKLIKDGNAYVCTCAPQVIKENRAKGIECACRYRSVEENLTLWNKAKNGEIKPGEAVVRIKGDMKSPDYSLRDPTIFRIKFTSYKPYKLWPLYDFENAVEDYLCGVTHILRSNEFRVSAQDLIRKLLGLPRPTIIQYARYNFKGTPFSKRKIRALIEAGKISGWDDLRLPTMSAIERRGIKPEAIKEFVIRAGYSEASHKFDWTMLLSLNRKVLDPISKRMFFVENPVPIKIDYNGEVEIPYHPTNDLGKRKIKVNGLVYISKNDLEEDKIIRLKDFMSIKIKDGIAEIVSKEKMGNEKIIQWVGSEYREVTIIKIGTLLNENGEVNENSLQEVHGFAETNVDELNEGDIVQFERFGFVRLDNKEKRIFIFSC
jgi:glutamyl-tRNA synthetase